MASGINLSIVADVRNAVREFERTGESLDQVADKLQDVATEGTRTGRALEGDIRDASRVVEREASGMERDFKEAFRTAAKESKDASRDIERNTKRAMDDSETYTGEFKDEARQNFSEITSSFSGDMDSIADLAQGTLGGLAGSIAGPFGIAAGVVAAAGGLFYTQWKENAEKVEERVQSMYDDMIASGVKFLSEDFINQQLADIYGKTENAVIGWDRLQAIVAATGLTEAQVARAFAGDASDRQALLEVIGTKIDENTAKMQEFDDPKKRYPFGETIQSLQEMEGDVSRVANGIDDATTRAEGYRDAIKAAGDEVTKIPYRRDVEIKTYFDYKPQVDAMLSDIERRRITLTVDPKITGYGRSTA